MARKKAKSEKPQTTTLFQHLNAIQTNQSVSYWDNLESASQKSYSVYMINRLLSMNMDYVELVNEFQKLYEPMTGRESYLFYSQMLPKRKQWNKYVKAQKESKHDSLVIDLLAHHFQISKSEAESYADLYMATTEGKESLRKILEMYGTDAKTIRKVTK